MGTKLFKKSLLCLHLALYTQRLYQVANYYNFFFSVFYIKQASATKIGILSKRMRKTQNHLTAVWPSQLSGALWFTEKLPFLWFCR